MFNMYSAMSIRAIYRPLMLTPIASEIGKAHFTLDPKGRGICTTEGIVLDIFYIILLTAKHDLICTLKSD